MVESKVFKVAINLFIGDDGAAAAAPPAKRNFIQMAARQSG